MSKVPDFTEAEQWSAETTLKERWPKQQLENQLADVEIRIHPQDREFTICPAIFWEVGATRLVMVKVAGEPYRSQFYYRGYQQYGTGKSDYDDITDCAVTMLEVHADKETTASKESA